MKYEKIFNEKIDFFKDHSKYPWLRKEADAALLNRSGFGLSVIISDDFIDRIVAMPKEYIQDWLDGKNQLLWRRQDELMLNAIKGNFVDLHTRYPDVEIHKIHPDNVSFYKSLGFSLLEEQSSSCFVGKLGSKDSLDSQIQAASSRAAAQDPSDKTPGKEFPPER